MANIQGTLIGAEGQDCERRVNKGETSVCTLDSVLDVAHKRSFCFSGYSVPSTWQGNIPMHTKSMGHSGLCT